MLLRMRPGQFVTATGGLKYGKSVDKPGSVVDNHSSRPCVTAGLKQHTRVRTEPIHSTPIWPCSEWGLPCPAALSPQAVGSYPTISTLPRTLRPFGGMFSVALAVGLRRPGVTWHSALWSPDFPRRLRDAVVWPTPPRPLSHKSPERFDFPEGTGIMGVHSIRTAMS